MGRARLFQAQYGYYNSTGGDGSLVGTTASYSRGSSVEGPYLSRNPRYQAPTTPHDSSANYSVVVDYNHEQNVPTMSPASSDHGRTSQQGYRPSQPPPAVPQPAGHGQYNKNYDGDTLKQRKYMDGINGGLTNLTITTNQSSNGRLGNSARPNQVPPPAPAPGGLLRRAPPAGGQPDMMNDRSESPDFPLPPPPEQLVPITLSTASLSFETSLPTPPPSNESASGKTAVDGGRSALLRAIEQGIELKKTGRAAERRRDRAAVERGEHDVAAILRKRMADVLGSDDDEEEEERQQDRHFRASVELGEWD